MDSRGASCAARAASEAVAARATRSRAMAATLVAGLVAAAALPVDAAVPPIAGNFREGLWEMTVRAEVPGTKPMPPIVLKKCISAQEIQDLQAKASRPPGSDQCKVLDQRTQGSTTSWKLECTGRMKIIGDGSVTLTGDSYSMQSAMVMTGADGKSMQVKNELSGKRLGDCKPGSP
jgi:hypothetical protein